MLSIEEFEIMLDEIAQELPSDFYNKLNGGILLLPEIKFHPEGRADDLYVLGQYNHNNAMGSYIVIYYGSFERVYGCLSTEALREEVKKTLIHEFTHHLETLAGDRSLVKKDEEQIRKYRKNSKN